ncbi:MAG: PSD1 and planctomycete cytochrome C domain-containing protein [Terriglobia bacterium]
MNFRHAKRWAHVACNEELMRVLQFIANISEDRVVGSNSKASRIAFPGQSLRFSGGAFLGMVLLTLCSASFAFADSDLEFFESKVRPLLATQCYSCHSSKATIIQGGLRLDSRETILHGGHSGPALVPGNPNQSLLIRALRHEVQPYMPPWGKLEPENIALLEEWIRRGAPWPQEPSSPVSTEGSSLAKSNAQKSHWAWQPIAPRPPVGAGSAWARDAIDGFLLDKLLQKGLKPAPPAEPATLLRRVYLDLIGLPPNSDRVQSFLADPSSAHYEAIIDDLLSSTRYGERWGRWWLDVTYYGDTLDTGSEIPATEAWRYRDYVIRAFNDDKPVNRFIREQIAGDLLPANDQRERNELVVATGYLAIGPWAIVLVDKPQLQMDAIDQQLELIGRGILGLTLGCARCHDHKFDPISLRDYYGMAGILKSTRTLHGKYKPDGVFSDVNKVSLVETAEERQHREEELHVYEQEIAALQTILGSLKETAAKLKNQEPKDKEKSEEVDAKIKSLETRIGLLEFNQPLSPFAHAVQDEATPEDCRIAIRGNAHQLGEKVPRGFVQLATFEGSPSTWRGSGRLELAEWLTDDRQPLTPRVYVNRVWQQLFGAGIVRSSDNFGIRGDPPSHPELLDYLASEFIKQGWSTKALVRRLVLTNAYRMSASPSPAAHEIDPENRLLSHMNARRLEAETIRDGILAITGKLDLTVGGATLPTHSLDTFVPNLTTFNPPQLIITAHLPENLRYRRTVYLPIFRSKQMKELDILNYFDFPVPTQVNASRRATVVPTQSLFLLNSPWIEEQAEVLATKLAQDDRLLDRQRVNELILLIYNRKPQESEIMRGLEFIYDFERRMSVDQSGKSAGPPGRLAWAAFIQMLFASNEFLYRI